MQDGLMEVGPLDDDRFQPTDRPTLPKKSNLPFYPFFGNLNLIILLEVS
ncbi:unnamed protein product [Onchocerca flexuosa]|uniref:Cytochrome P450 n=1 Tax=Onchocerca flexuosa TaxID=387005 RepID=A0A183HXU0_9BILA|nr:unnamed protein product [Onchocerca flexuosa]